MTTERFFDHLLNSMFAQQHDKVKDSRGQREPLVTKIFDYIKHNVSKSVSVSASYDYASRRAAMAKLKNMTVQVGSPGFLLDRKYLKVMYNPLLVQKTDFFQNIQYGVMFLRKREELALVSPSEESRWLDLLNKDSASYSEAANKVIIPEVLLQKPLFHPGFPNSVNLGGLGVKISEAVIRGVVGYGLLFDTRGLLQWAGPGPDSGVMPGSGLSSNISDSIYAQPLSAFQSSSQCLARRFAGLGLDWRIGQRWSLIGQLDAHAAPADSAITALGDDAIWLTLGARWRFAERWALDLSFIEDVQVETAPDVTFQASLRYQLPD